MYMMDIRTVSLSNSVYLSTNAHSVDYVKASRCLSPTVGFDRSLEGLTNPRSTVLAIKSLTCSLECSALGFGSGRFLEDQFARLDDLSSVSFFQLANQGRLARTDRAREQHNAKG